MGKHIFFIRGQVTGSCYDTLVDVYKGWVLDTVCGSGVSDVTFFNSSNGIEQPLGQLILKVSCK